MMRLYIWKDTTPSRRALEKELEAKCKAPNIFFGIGLDGLSFTDTINLLG
jgi:hypothetical protein